MSDGRVFNKQNLSFMSSMLSAKKASGEEPVQILWTTILGTWFPLIEPYKLAFKSATAQTDHAPDGIVIEIRFTPTATARSGGGHQVNHSYEIQEFQIFFAECKRPQQDTPGGWDGACAQLSHYFEVNVNGSNRMYGAIGIGTKVMFYEWNRNLTPSLQPLHASKIDVSEPGGRIELESLLQHVKLNGWDLASTSIP